MINLYFGCTLSKKWDNVILQPNGHGHYKVTIQHQGKTYHAITCNMPLVDKFQSKQYGWKKAGNDLYDYVKLKNNLK